ncbi:MAG: type II secretion system protein [Longicatena sp.]
MKKTLKKNKKGFTLVEIIVVLVIMGILLAIAVPSVMGYVNKANEQKYIAQARNGFLGATTIVATENAKDIVNSERPVINAAAINKEIGESTTDGLIKTANCTYGTTALPEDTTKTIRKIVSCEISVKDKADKKVVFTADKDAVMTAGAAADGTN